MNITITPQGHEQREERVAQYSSNLQEAIERYQRWLTRDRRGWDCEAYGAAKRVLRGLRLSRDDLTQLQLTISTRSKDLVFHSAAMAVCNSTPVYVNQGDSGHYLGRLERYALNGASGIIIQCGTADETAGCWSSTAIIAPGADKMHARNIISADPPHWSHDGTNIDPRENAALEAYIKGIIAAAHGPVEDFIATYKGKKAIRERIYQLSGRRV
jgi:hypothetical protein